MGTLIPKFRGSEESEIMGKIIAIFAALIFTVCFFGLIYVGFII